MKKSKRIFIEKEVKSFFLILISAKRKLLEGKIQKVRIY